MSQTTGISRPPTRGELLADRWFRVATRALAWAVVALVLLLVVQIAVTASPAIAKHGLRFLTGTKWDAGKEDFGILPQIGGTLYSSVLGGANGSPVGVAVACVLTQNYLPPRLEVVLKNVIELLAAIPSVVYGLWGIFVVIPAVRPLAAWLHEYLGGIGIFGTRLAGPGMLPAALVLAIMVLPTV